MKGWRNDFLIHTNFWNMIITSLFYCCKFYFIVPYEYMDSWEKFNETSLPGKKKKEFYSHLNMEDIFDADYANTKSL